MVLRHLRLWSPTLPVIFIVARICPSKISLLGLRKWRTGWDLMKNQSAAPIWFHLVAIREPSTYVLRIQVVSQCLQREAGQEAHRTTDEVTGRTPHAAQSILGPRPRAGCRDPGRLSQGGNVSTARAPLPFSQSGRAAGQLSRARNCAGDWAVSRTAASSLPGDFHSSRGRGHEPVNHRIPGLMQKAISTTKETMGWGWGRRETDFLENRSLTWALERVTRREGWGKKPGIGPEPRKGGSGRSTGGLTLVWWSGDCLLP